MRTVKTFKLPDLGEGLTEADLLSWSVAIGDVIVLNQVIAEVETVKASVELPSPYEGTVVALHAKEGTTITVGSPLLDVEVDDISGDDSGPAPTPDTAPVRTPVLVGYGVATESVSRRRKRSTVLDSAPSSTPGARVVPEVSQESRPLASPPVRYAAKQLGIDLRDVVPTGDRGQITRADLKQHVDIPSTVAVQEVVTRDDRGDDERIPIKGVRKHTAVAMTRSAFTAPHVTVFVDVDVTDTLELITRLRGSKYFSKVRLTPLALVARALLIALRTNPTLNSSWDEEAQEIVVKKYVNLGIAAATPRGLMVPNIKNAHLLGLHELAVALSDLTATAKAGKTGPADLVEGTVTITNIGVFGVDAGTPILNPGEAAILCFGAIRRRPWEFEGEIALRSITTLSLSFDHRLVDGEQGSTFLATIAEILADPVSTIALN